MKHQTSEAPGHCGIIPLGIGVPTKYGATVTRPEMDSDFFYAPSCAGSMAPFMAGRVGASQDAPVPYSGTPTPHGLPPSIGVEGGRLTTCQYGANMATPFARAIAPKIPRYVITGNHHADRVKPHAPPPGDPIARQQAIENALSMALHLVRTGSTTDDLNRATGRAVRAASMLKQACSERSAV